MISGATAQTLVTHYVSALEMRRKAHQMGAIFGGKLPCTGSLVVGGCTEAVTAEKVADFRAVLTELRGFIDNIYLADVQTLATAFPTYYQHGAGPGNLLAYGAFELNSSGTSKLFSAGRHTGGIPGAVDPAQITEYVGHSWYTPASGNVNPAAGVTQPDAEKPGAYSWLKAPRYVDQPHELGPLARMWINGEYTNGVSVLDRIAARAAETKKIADAMAGWLDELTPGAPTRVSGGIPQQATSAGMTEAPRGALGHWMDIDNSVVSRYQVITPTNWKRVSAG